MTEQITRKVNEALQALEEQRAPRGAARCAGCKHAIRIGRGIVHCLLRKIDQHNSCKACHVYQAY